MAFLIAEINKFSYIISPIFYKLVYMSIIATIVGLVLIISGNILRRKISPKWVSRIWIVFLFTLLVPINIQSKYSIYNYIPTNILIFNTEISNIADTSYREEYDKVKSEYDNNITYNEALGIDNTNSLGNNVNNTYIKSLVFDIVLPYLWLFIVCVILLIYIVSYIVFNRKIGKNICNDTKLLYILEKCKKDLNIKKNIKIVFQGYIKVPSIFGIFNVRILLNENINNLSDEQMEYIFSHELSHYKRKDNILIMLVTIIKYIYFFNPLIWFMLIALKKDVEMATDEIALQNKNEKERQEYCKTLVNITNLKSNMFIAKALCISDDQKNLEKRIIMIKLFDNFKKHTMIVSIISIFVILIMGLTFCTAKVLNKKEITNIDKLSQYEDTYIGNNSSVNAILELLPFSKYKQKIELQTTIKPYELTIYYNMNEKTNALEYNNMVLFSLINNLDTIHYIFVNDQEVTVTREYYNQIVNLNFDDVNNYVDEGYKLFRSSEFYSMTINESGVKVFKNSSLAFSQFKKDYKEAIDTIRDQFNLLPLTSFTYQQYETYGWQVVLDGDNEDLRNKCIKVSQFFDIYENGSLSYEILEKFPMKEVKIIEPNVENTIQSIGLVANNILSNYCGKFYNDDVLPNQKISNFIPIEDHIVAGDKEEFVAIVEYKVKSEYPIKRGISTWGAQDAEGYSSGEIMLRIKRDGADDVKETVTYYEQPINGKKVINKSESYTTIYTPYKLVSIGEKVSSEGLKTILDNDKIPVKSY